jgi:hypothetical protein
MKKKFSVLLIVLYTFCVGSCISGEKKLSGNFVSPSANNSNFIPDEKLNQADKVEMIDDDTLLKTLISLENEWKQAKRSGQTDKLNQIYADEFTNKDEDGNVYTKADWLNYWRNGNPNLKSIKITDGKLVSRLADTATISFKVTSVYKYKNKFTTETIDTDSFVFRDGRWQAVSSISKDADKK